MYIPEKAIICTPKYEDAVKLDKFLREHTNRWIALDQWHDEEEDTCWDLLEENSDHRLFHESYDFYEDCVRDVDLNNEPSTFIPDDPMWRFLSVDEFIARCVGFDCPDDGDIEVGDLL